MSVGRRVIAVSRFWLAAGCGSGGHPSIFITPDGPVVAGGSSVSFTATLVDTNGLVSWTLTGPGTFNPLGGSGALYAPPASVPSPTDATLSASSGTLVAHVTIGVNPTPGITRTFTTR